MNWSMSITWFHQPIPPTFDHKNLLGSDHSIYNLDCTLGLDLRLWFKQGISSLGSNILFLSNLSYLAGSENVVRLCQKFLFYILILIYSCFSWTKILVLNCFQHWLVCTTKWSWDQCVRHQMVVEEILREESRLMCILWARIKVNDWVIAYKLEGWFWSMFVRLSLYEVVIMLPSCWYSI